MSEEHEVAPTPVVITNSAQFDMKTVITLVSAVIALAGGWFSLRAEIIGVKSNIDHTVSREEFIERTVNFATKDDVRELRSEVLEIRALLMKDTRRSSDE